ncbi:MAG: phosphoribosylanthranilate isomerase [Alphaproteobacteria bacterium]
MSTEIKICGITTPDALSATAKSGARYAGFVFYEPSPRFVSPEVAAQFCRALPTGLRGVTLFVDPDDALIDATVVRLPMDYIQLHGSESPARVAELKARTGLKVIKAFGVRDKDDLKRAEEYAPLVDMFLFDAKPPADPDALPGGNGLSFDWRILDGYNGSRPWMLSGGLDPDTVGDAIKLTRPPAVDVSSGVEASRGVKDVAKIHAFADAVRAADADVTSAQAEKWGLKL